MVGGGGRGGIGEEGGFWTVAVDDNPEEECGFEGPPLAGVDETVLDVVGVVLGKDIEVGTVCCSEILES